MVRSIAVVLVASLACSPSGRAREQGDPRAATQLVGVGKQQPTQAEIVMMATDLEKQGLRARALQLLAKLTDPSHAADVAIYREGKLLQIRLLRLSKDFDQAGKTISHAVQGGWADFRFRLEQAYLYQDEKAWHAAALIWSSMLNSREEYRNCIKKLAEQAHLYQNQRQWGRAAVAWRNIMELLKPHLEQGTLREEYYRSNIGYAKCLYLYADTLQNPNLAPMDLAAKKLEYIERAAKLFIKLEGIDTISVGLKQECAAFVRENAPLKAAYDQAK